MKTQTKKYILIWLRLAAILQLKKNNPIIIGVTGSAGKTSAVKAINEVLKTKYTVQNTLTGNSETGIPFELLGIPVKNYTHLEWIKVILLSIWQTIFYWPKYQLLIVEMGIDSDQAPKNMTYLLGIVKPTVGVFLNVNNVHGANFSGKNVVRAIATEKGKLLSSLPKNGLAIYSGDHPNIINLEKNISAQKKKFSVNQRADMQLLKHNVSLKSTKFIFLAHKKQHALNFIKQAHFQEAFGGFASALLVGEYFGVNIEDGINALEKKFQLLPGRMSILEGVNNSIILDSSYNSSLEPAIAALKMLNKISVRGKKIAILGDMREIGKQESLDHEKLAQAAAKNADEIILIGPLTAKYTLPKLQKLKFAKTRIHSFITAHEAIKTVKKIIKPHDLILIKGSQNTIFLEIIVKAIMAHPEKASELLCRQSRYWEKQRRLV